METVTQAQITNYRRSYEERLAMRQKKNASRRKRALQIVKSVVPTIAASISSVEKVFLFGSIIGDSRFHQHSDIDIGVVGTTAIDYFDFWKKLEEALPDWTIDLRDADDNSFFASRVRQTGLLIYERTPSTAAS